MSFIDVYIGDLDDEGFSWEGGDYNGNIPRRLSSKFPLGRMVFSDIVGKILRSELEGKQVDFGGWVAKLTAKELDDYVLSYYKSYEIKSVVEDVDKIRGFISELKKDKKYALVACET